MLFITYVYAHVYGKVKWCKVYDKNIVMYVHKTQDVIFTVL